MSFESEYEKLRKKRLKEAEESQKSTSKKSFTEQYDEAKSQWLATEKENANTVAFPTYMDLKQRQKESDTPLPLLPTLVRGNMSASELHRDKEAWKANAKKFVTPEESTIFQSGAFDDGYQFGDVFKSVIATAGDTILSGAQGFGNFFEGIFDLAAYGTGEVADWLGMEDVAEQQRKAAEYEGINTLFDFLRDQNKKLNAQGYAISLEDNTLLGDKGRGFAETLGGVGGMLATAGLGGAVGLSAKGASYLGTASTFASSTGSGIDEAYKAGATDEDAWKYGASKGVIDAGTELMFGGLGKGIKALGISKSAIPIDDWAATKLTSNIKNVLAKNSIQLGVKTTAEGFEELAAGYLTALAQKGTYRSEEDLNKLIEDQDLIEQFVMGALASGAYSGRKWYSSVKSGRDYITGLTANEQTVVDKEIANRIANGEKDGNTLTKKEKSKIESEVLEDLKKGYISTDTIESVLGGETFKSYQSILDKEKPLQDEIDKITKNETLTDEQKTTLIESVNEKLQTLGKDTNKAQIKEQLNKELSEIMTKDNYLQESYKEKERRTQRFAVDLSNVKNEYARKTYENAIKYGENSKYGMNNGTETHEFVDFAAKLAEQRGYEIDFTNTEILKKSIEDGNPYNIKADPNTVEAFVSKKNKKIVLNMDAKKSFTSLVGHEITHTLEGTDADAYKELQGAVFKYAEIKKEYKDRYKRLENNYSTLDADIKEELTADLVGDYVFTDADFVKRLSVEHRNVFQKIYDEIKYLCKIATAGSKEARQLEKVKKAFDKAYRESSKATGDTDGSAASETQYSVSVTDKKTIDFLDNQEHIVTYKSMQVIDGKLYPPMAAKVKGADGKYHLNTPSQLGVWQQATEDPSNIKKIKNGIGYYTLNKGDGTSIDAAYNPYEHSSNLVLNDQFESAHRRNNLVTVECIIPVSEMSSGYRAQYAKDSTGVMDWKAGVVAGQIKDNKRKVYLSRYLKPVRILSDAETAQKYKDILDGTGVSVPFNVVSPSLLTELEKVGVDIDYDGSPMYQSNQKRKAEKEAAKNSTKYSLSAEQQEYFKDSKVRDENGNLKVMYHGTSKGGHTVFDTYGSNYGLFGQGSYFTDNKSVAESYTNKGKGNNKQVYESYLNITNPIDMDAQADADAWKKAMPEADFPENGTNEQFYRAMEEHLAYEEYPKWEAAEIAMDVIQSMGYDGITHIGGGRVNADGVKHQVYIAFEPEQIKNIDNLKPTSDPDIRYSLSEDSEGNALTDGQKEYFKDSKAVDENGNLLKVYHTTKNDFTVFDKARKGEATEDANTYLGFFFADDSEYMANFPEFKNGKTEAYYLNMTNPIDMTNISREAFADIVEVMGGDVQEAIEVYDEEGGGQLGHLLDAMTGEFSYQDFIKELRPHYDELMSRGYDGVVNHLDEDYGAKEYIVLDSNQAKLTTNTNPTTDADIRYSLSDYEGKPIDTARISSNEFDTKYSLSHNSEIAKGQTDYIVNNRAKAFVTEAELAEAQKVTNAMVDVMMKYSSILPEDKIGKVLTKNGSYDRSVENTTICVRTLAYNEFVDKVQEEIGRPLTQMESFLVSQKLYDIATEPQCLYCYVSLDRKAFNDMLLRYMQDRDSVIAKYNNSDKSNEAIEKLYEEFLHGRKPTKEMRERFDNWLGYVDNGTQLLSLADIATEDRQSVINANGGNLAAQLKDARKYAQSASWSKIQKNYVAYRDEILKLGDRVVKNLNEHYGLRWYSFSDYSAAFIVENMQQITDASIRGLKGLSYTKDTDFAEIFAPSGMNVNISVFVNTDKNGNFYIDEKQSANFEKAKELRERYPNVGIVATVTNDEALRWAGEQEWSDVIIPFHIVRTGTDVAEYYKWLNYTSESADTVSDKDLWNAYVDSLNLNSENARKKVSKNIYPNEHKNDKATYLNLCESRGLSPRFARFAGEDWYMKLVNETRLSADNSSALKPTYNLEAAQASFQKFIDKGGYEGGWYKKGVNVDAEAKIVADDVLAGKKANEVDYGRQDGFVPEDLIAGRKNNRKHGQYSISFEGETPKEYGNFNFYGKDMMLDTSMDIAPVQEDVAVDDIAPTAAYEAIKPKPEKPIVTAKSRNGTKLESVQTELTNNKTLREESLADFNQEIARLQDEYDSKKNKNTKYANNLLRRIERTKRLRDSVDADYAKRISNLETKEKLMREGKPTARQELHQNLVDGLKTKFTEKGYDFDKVLKGAKNLSTFSTVDNTPQRVMEKALGYKEGQILADETVNKVAQNETEGIKWLNSFTNRKDGILAKLSKQYDIKPGSKESAAAQMYAEGFYVNENDELVTYGDAELKADFPNERVRNNIKNLATDPRIRSIYDETLARINESRTRNAYPEIPRLDNYFLHFRAMEDTFSRLGLPFNPNDIRAKDLPTDLNGVTADLKPGQPYFASAMHRKGNRTSFDLLGGLERYLTSAKNQIYHIDDIQTLRALRNYIADNYGQAKGLESLDTLTEEEAQERIKQVYNSHLSTFAKFLNEEANILAGKTSLIDRGLEGIIGRRGITFLDTVNKQVGSNMVGFNLSSALTNFISGVQAIAKTNKLACVKSLAQTTASKVGSLFGKTDSFVENNPTIIRRKGADRFHRTPFQKIGDAGYVLMGAVDNVTTEFIVRAKYNEFIQKGMSEQQAIVEADKWTSRLMGDRSLGQMPQLYNSKMLGLVTKFQLEVRNQLDSQFYDTIQETKASNEDIKNGLERNAKTAAKVTATFFELAVLQHLFGVAFESIAGYNPTFDIIEVLAKTFGLDDDEEDEDTVLDNVEEGFLTLLEDLPYTSTFTGGRIPISSALPIEELIKGEDEYGNEKSRLETLGEIAPYYLLPGGYGQIKKTAQGLSMFDEDLPTAGSYTDSGNLRFPIDDTFANRVQAGLFGQWASENARDYFDNERKPLNEKQTQEFIDVDMPIKDYWEYREGLSGLKTIGEKADYINELDLPISKKNLLLNNIADRKESLDMSDYDNYDNFEEFDFAQKNPEKYSFFKDNGISYKDYATADEDGKEAYTWAYNNPEKFILSKAVASDVVEYRKYTGELYDIKADKDENGNSISGSRKKKVAEYINNLDADYGEKIILFKSEYNADDTYNYEIIDYLNSREDISYKEMETILKELGFTVKADGRIEW